MSVLHIRLQRQLPRSVLRPLCPSTLCPSRPFSAATALLRTRTRAAPFGTTAFGTTTLGTSRSGAALVRSGGRSRASLAALCGGFLSSGGDGCRSGDGV